MRLQRTAGAIDRIHARQRYPDDVVISLGPLTGFAVTHIGTLSQGVCSDNSEIAAGTQVFVRHTGRNNDHIAATNR